ncbi:hypothetical protein KL86PLE_90102 [uncultured Pleomorphomonas sp.]|uniref:Uncharacterized protein n=1 Tax=uncultured Pleomorphomonas sp. TaxID=442121 RepID=A0A212LMS3_9HYPH|nr:hypothetical protein KL86PLE_90102 [uncultured Pleomorphomonas sp.]
MFQFLPAPGGNAAVSDPVKNSEAEAEIWQWCNPAARNGAAAGRRCCETRLTYGSGRGIPVLHGNALSH